MYKSIKTRKNKNYFYALIKDNNEKIYNDIDSLESVVNEIMENHNIPYFIDTLTEKIIKLESLNYKFKQYTR